jgi:hypothetical protein
MIRFLLIAISAFLVAPARSSSLLETSGLVQIRADGSDSWHPAGSLPRPLKPGESIRTGFHARAVVDFEAGAALELGGNTQVKVADSVKGGMSVDMLFGTARASSRLLGGRPVELRTPAGSARASSDAAAWRTAASPAGSTFEIEAGLVSVTDIRGATLHLRDGERVETDLAGAHEQSAVPAPAQADRAQFAAAMRRELALELDGDEPLRRVAGELRRQEYEAGRILTDAEGRRVRAEEFVVRVAANQFSFVTLNERKNSGLSWYSWNGVFDRGLPTNLESVIASLPGTIGAASPWTLTDFVQTRSNGVDSLVYRGSGGHQVDVNSNALPDDDVSSVFDGRSDTFRPAAGKPVFQVLFDHLALYSDGVFKRGRDGVNVQIQADAAENAVYTPNSTFPDPAAVRQEVREVYQDGTNVIIDNAALSSVGSAVGRASFGPATTGDAWQAGLLRSAFETRATATEFGGRSIDLVVSPRALIGSPRVLDEPGGLR